MTRPALIVVLYSVIGTALTLFVYRVVLEGAFAPPAAERGVDGIILFVSIALNTGLAFGAAAVLSVMIAQARWAFAAILLASVLLPGLVGMGMTLWFAGLGEAFAALMALNGALCAVLANRFGLFSMQGGGD